MSVIIYVDDITGQQYPPRDWESRVSYTLTISQDGQVIDRVDTLSAEQLAQYLHDDQEIEAQEALRESLKGLKPVPVPEVQEPEQVIQETLDLNADWMSEEQLREWERANRSNNHGIAGLRVDNQEV